MCETHKTMEGVSLEARKSLGVSLGQEKPLGVSTLQRKPWAFKKHPNTKLACAGSATEWTASVHT